MFQLSFQTFALAALALLLPGTANAHTNGSSTDTHSNTSTPSYPNSSPAYTLTTDLRAPTFFSHFNTFTATDPTNGHVNYTTTTHAAQQKNLAYLHNAATNETTTYLGVDSANNAPHGRNSVRLSSVQTFSPGMLAVMDVRHVPVGWGVWPAAWFLGTGDVWPGRGESDWLEWVNFGKGGNGMVLHTSQNCGVGNGTDGSGEGFMGTLEHEDCNEGDAMVGCGILAAEGEGGLATAGEEFNLQGGGVYVQEWTREGFTTWLFAHDKVPEDLRAEGTSPDPKSWDAKPLARHAGEGCDFKEKFRDMEFILNIAFCGDWAGRVWESSGAKASTGVETCEQFVSEHARAFEEAYWEIASLKIWTSGKEPGIAAPGYGKRDLEEVPDFSVLPRQDVVKGGLGDWRHSTAPPSPPFASGSPLAHRHRVGGEKGKHACPELAHGGAVTNPHTKQLVLPSSDGIGMAMEAVMSNAIKRPEPEVYRPGGKIETVGHLAAVVLLVAVAGFVIQDGL